jgi:biopolymer transport protein ExbD
MIEPTPRRQPVVPLTPLIDVVFNILTFFIVFSVFRGSEAAIGLRLPKAATGEQHSDAPLVVTVDEKESFLVNGYRLDRAGFRAEMARTLKRNPEQTVIIKADRDVRYARLVEALDSVRENGGSRIALAVEPQPGKGSAPAAAR